MMFYLREFRMRLYARAKTPGLILNWLGIRRMKKKWESCLTNGNLNFNSDLLGPGNEAQDYVIWHG